MVYRQRDRKRSVLIVIFCLLMCLSSASLAHSGGTDSNGGHHNTETGEYHYHHGYPAHQHPGGVCPYASGGTGTRSSNGGSSITIDVVQPEPVTLDPSSIDISSYFATSSAEKSAEIKRLERENEKLRTTNGILIGLGIVGFIGLGIASARTRAKEQSELRNKNSKLNGAILMLQLENASYQRQLGAIAEANASKKTTKRTRKQKEKRKELPSQKAFDSGEAEEVHEGGKT